MKRFAVSLMIVLVVFLFCSVPVFASEKQKEASGNSEAFERSLESRLPMSAEQIEEFKKRLKDTERAVNKRTPPKMTNRSKRLSFETGEKPPVIRIAPGYVTTLSFFDSTGQPWPITSVVLGNPNYYTVQRPENQGNIITVSVLKDHVDSNLALTFEDQNVPATIQLKTVSEGGETDSLAVFRAEQRGPNAEKPTIGPEPEPTVDSDMMGFVDNVPPDSAKRMRLTAGKDAKEKKEPEESGDIVLWAYKDSFYLRTKHGLVWPAWDTVANGPGGVRVYEMAEVSSLMISRNGASVTYTVEGAYGE